MGRRVYDARLDGPSEPLRAVERVAPDQIAALVDRHISSRGLWIFGEPRVNVLELNLELEKTFPAREIKEISPAAEAAAAPAASPAAVSPETQKALVASEPPSINPSKQEASKQAAPARGAAAAVFPSEISPAHAGEKRHKARLRTCSDQYRANAAANANGGLKWRDYWKLCKKRLTG